MNKNSEQIIKDLTMMLLYLTKFQDRDIPCIDDKAIYNAWKGYNFDILNELDKEDYIRQGKNPSKSKYVYITEEGIKKAQELLSEYGIAD
ncbi:DUF6429 family protein [Anaerosporobacter sp.]|uniref:DUF6429 family protein n=1 Tax=Anaerosporobacter sp. TaxID=1872529 RepID=UPI00286F39AE|nr:DUF6429 family protein [Anaerosporobacter sp.]